MLHEEQFVFGSGLVSSCGSYDSGSLPMFPFHTVGPVSYTHLDVYKRQGLKHPQWFMKMVILTGSLHRNTKKTQFLQVLWLPELR